MDQITIEYRGSREARPELKIRVLPNEETIHNAGVCESISGHLTSISMYCLREKCWSMRSMKMGRTEEKRRKKDGFPYDASQTDTRVSRFAALNDMSRCLAQKDGQKLKEKMEKYLTDHAAMESLFSLM